MNTTGSTRFAHDSLSTTTSIGRHCSTLHQANHNHRQGQQQSTTKTTSNDIKINTKWYRDACWSSMDPQRRAIQVLGCTSVSEMEITLITWPQVGCWLEMNGSTLCTTFLSAQWAFDHFFISWISWFYEVYPDCWIFVTGIPFATDARVDLGWFILMRYICASRRCMVTNCCCPILTAKCNNQTTGVPSWRSTKVHVQDDCNVQQRWQSSGGGDLQRLSAMVMVIPIVSYE